MTEKDREKDRENERDKEREKERETTFAIEVTHSMHNQILDEFPELVKHYLGYTWLKKGWKTMSFHFDKGDSKYWEPRIKQFTNK